MRRRSRGGEGSKLRGRRPWDADGAVREMAARGTKDRQSSRSRGATAARHGVKWPRCYTYMFGRARTRSSLRR